MPFPGNTGSIHSPTTTPQRSELATLSRQLSRGRKEAASRSGSGATPDVRTLLLGVMCLPRSNCNQDLPQTHWDWSTAECGMRGMHDMLPLRLQNVSLAVLSRA